MTRPSIAPDGVAAIALAVFVNVLLGLYFAADAHVDPRAPLPPYAIRPSAELLAALQAGDTQPIPLIRVAFRRPDSDTLANALLGFLVWLPLTVSVLAAILQYHILCLMQPSPPVRIRAAIITVSLLAASFLWAIIDNTIFGLLMVTVIIGAILAMAIWRPYAPRRGVLIIALAFMVAGTSASLTSHRLYTIYHGLVTVPFSDQNTEQHVLSELQRDINATVHITADDVFDRIERIPAMNAWGSGPAIFAKNRAATKTLVVSVLIYLLMFACDLLRLEADYVVKTGFKVAYALGLYLAVGASFGLVYYNDVLSAAGRQNVLCILAEGASVPPEQFDRLREQFMRFGWSQKLERAMEDVRNTATPRAGYVLRAALAEHWSNSVIAQEQPQSANDGDGRLRPEARLVANQTLADMFYFSFASFTTTGYGDLRPVSDSARFWSIIENIAELLFTAIFFVVALTERNLPEERRQTIQVTPHPPPSASVAKVLGLAFGVLFLMRCTTVAEQPIGGSEFPAAPNTFCPVLATNDDVRVHVIIDDSRSMRGYFTAGSTYTRHLHALLDTLAASANVSFHRLSDPSKPVRLEEAYGEEFYSRPDTPLSTAFVVAAEDGPNTSVVVISDLQQGERGGIQVLADAIKKAMGIRPFVSMYGWKANYVNNKGGAGLRGWYAVLMSDSGERLSLVERASGVQAQSFEGPFPVIGVEHAEGPYIFRSRSFTRLDSLEWIDDESTDLEWQPVIKTGPLYKCKGSQQTVQYSAFVRLVPKGGVLRFRGVLSTEIPLADIGDVTVTIHRVSSDSKGAIMRSAVVPTETTYVEVHRPAFVTGTTPKGGGTESKPATRDSPPSRIQVIPLEIAYSLPIDSKKSSYLVELRAGRLNLSCPQWVKDWSTADRGEWQKTLNLENIVKTMLEASSKDEMFLVHYLVLVKAPAL